MPHIRFARVEKVVESAYSLNNFFNELNNRSTIKDVSLMYYWEIQDMLRVNKIDVKNIEKRVEGHSFLIIKDKFYHLSAQNADSIRKIVDSKIHEGDSLKGQIASLGFAKGKAKVLFSAKECYKIEKGDILITSMTTPDYVPAMQKSAAIVTDEGGLSCHAAIVSREMGKPCIIGTKIATKVFKDGDLVEVDANKGVIRKLNKL